VPALGPSGVSTGTPLSPAPALDPSGVSVVASVAVMRDAVPALGPSGVSAGAAWSTPLSPAPALDPSGVSVVASVERVTGWRRVTLPCATRGALGYR